MRGEDGVLWGSGRANHCGGLPSALAMEEAWSLHNPLFYVGQVMTVLEFYYPSKMGPQSGTKML